MTTYSRKIKDSLAQILNLQDKDIVTIHSATVTAVDEDSRTCTVTTIHANDKIEIDNVQLQAEVSDGMLLIPAIDSTVFIAITNQQSAFVLSFSDIDKYILIIAKSRMQMTSTGIIFNDGSYNGLVIGKNLSDNLNLLIAKINDLITVFSAWTPVSGDGGLALKTALASWILSTLDSTTENQFENSTITHGHP